MNTRSEPRSVESIGYERGQRLFCAECRSEIEIINPTNRPGGQDFRCCGMPMQPNTEVAVHLDEQA